MPSLLDWESGIGKRSSWGTGIGTPAGLDSRCTTGLRETETPLLKGKHKSHAQLKTRAKAVISKETGSDIPAGLGWGDRGQLWLTVGTRTWVTKGPYSQL